MLSCPIVNLVSYIPVVFVLALSTSASIGMYSGAAIRDACSKKLQKLAKARSENPTIRTKAPNPSNKTRFVYLVGAAYKDHAIMSPRHFQSSSLTEYVDQDRLGS